MNKNKAGVEVNDLEIQFTIIEILNGLKDSDANPKDVINFKKIRPPYLNMKFSCSFFGKILNIKSIHEGYFENKDVTVGNIEVLEGLTNGCKVTLSKEQIRQFLGLLTPTQKLKEKYSNLATQIEVKTEK